MIDKDLLILLGERKKYIFHAVILMLIRLLLSIVITACLCLGIGLLLDDADRTKYIFLISVAFACIVLRYILYRITEAVKDKLSRQTKKDLREKIYRKILKLASKTNDQLNMAALTQVSVEGVEQLDLYFSNYIPQFFYAMLAPLILFVTTVWIEWKVSVALILCVPLIPVSIMLVSKYAKKIFAKYWGKYTSMGDKFLDSVQGLKELKIFKADEKCHEKINESAEEFRKITMKVLVMQLSSITIMDLVAYVGAAMGIMFSILSAKSNHILPIEGLFLVLLAVEFFLPLRAFGSAFHVAMNGASAGRTIIELLSTPDPVWGDRTYSCADIILDNVSFSYDKKRKVLKHINMHLPRVGMSAIVGESGCGKSTVVNLLSGAFVPDEGKVCIGDIPIRSLNRDEFYKKITIVSYNSYIFHLSVRENFYIAKENATDEEMYTALEKVNLLGFIKENGGLDKIIQEDAKNISGGQKQRLALAIALLADKDIYVFDEATSNIDIESEAIIMQTVERLSKYKNVIVISHRLANIVKADTIYYMQNGEIKESGSHEELMKNQNGYSKLYNAQKKLEQAYKEVIQ